MVGEVVLQDVGRAQAMREHRAGRRGDLFGERLVGRHVLQQGEGLAPQVHGSPRRVDVLLSLAHGEGVRLPRAVEAEEELLSWAGGEGRGQYPQYPSPSAFKGGWELG